MSHFLAGTLTDKELQDLRQQYSGGSVSGHLGEYKPQRIEAPKAEPYPVHPDIEWKVREYNRNYPDEVYYPIFQNNINIEFNPENGGYGFYSEYDGDWYLISDCTPETIDDIIAKLEHFKRVVFGEGE